MAVFRDPVALFQWKSEGAQYLAMHCHKICIEVGRRDGKDDVFLLEPAEQVFGEQERIERLNLGAHKIGQKQLSPIKVWHKAELFSQSNERLEIDSRLDSSEDMGQKFGASLADSGGEFHW